MTNGQTLEQRNIALDIAKVVCAILVVGLHGNIFKDINDDLSYVFVNGICRIGVPLFFIVNGYFFSRVDNKEKLFDWGKRILTIYAVWSLLYAYISLQGSFFGNFVTIFYGYYHLWYLLAVLEACLLVYLLRNRNKLGLILSVVLFLIGLTIQYFNAYALWGNESIQYYAKSFFVFRNGLFFGFPFCYIGYLLAQHKFNLNISYTKHTAITILLAGLLLVESWANNINTSSLKKFDFLLFLLPLAPILFLLIMRTNIGGTSKNIAFTSIAIYLIHPFVFHLLGFLPFDAGNTINVCLTVLISALATYPLIKLNNKFKIFL